MYIGKVTRSGDDTLPKKFLAAWINKRKKNGAPQLTCNSNFTKTIELLLRECQPLSSRQASLKEWLPIAKDESLWKSKIDVNFEACHTIETDDEDENSAYSDSNDKGKHEEDESLNSKFSPPQRNKRRRGGKTTHPPTLSKVLCTYSTVPLSLKSREP
jgi:hypothetical protein